LACANGAGAAERAGPAASPASAQRDGCGLHALLVTGFHLDQIFGPGDAGIAMPVHDGRGTACAGIIVCIDVDAVGFGRAGLGKGDIQATEE
jgi:hypothetical protein